MKKIKLLSILLTICMIFGLLQIQSIPVAAAETWLWPVPYTQNVSQSYTGAYSAGLHSGIDIAAAGISGKDVIASKSGTVSAIYYDDWNLGNAVFIQHATGSYSQYLHLTSVTVSNGQQVMRGQRIGTVGSTGDSTDPHLHFSLSTDNSQAGGRYNNNKSVIGYDYNTGVKVTFNANGGSTTQPCVYYKNGTSYGTLPTATRSGYRFDGWYTSATGGSKFTTSTTVPGYDHGLYAHWTWLATVTFNANGGSVSPTSKQYVPGEAYGSLPTPTRAGSYRFDGWYTSATGGSRFTASTTVPGYNHGLYAHWTWMATVTFNANGGSVSPTSAKYAPGETYGSLPIPTRAGSYRFDGWYTSATGGSRFTASSTVPGYDHGLYAHWTWLCTATFNANGGSVSPTSKQYVPGETYGSLPTPTRAGSYRFDGWYTSATGGSKFTASSTVPGYDHGLYAHWTWLATVTFNANGGSVSPTSAKYAPGETYGSLPTPTRAGYRFDGWYTNATGGSKFTASSTVPGYDHGLYAHWSRQYTVTFFPLGGTCSPLSKIIYIGETYGTLPTPTRSGYLFKGWLTGIEGTLITSSSVVQSYDNDELYANWALLCNVSFNANGGTVSPSSKQYETCQPFGTLPTPTRAGYEFDGWYRYMSGDTEVLITSSSTVPEFYPSLTLYAHWK